MIMNFDFLKIQATGNDFILIAQEDGNGQEFSASEIRNMCDRRLGIGADGMIRIGHNREKQLRMSYFNSDGTPGEMCGNGLRAAVMYAHVMGMLPKTESCLVEATDGLHEVNYSNRDVISVEILTDRKIKDLPTITDLPADLQLLGFINTGVPHLVVEPLSGIEEIDVYGSGSHLRHHSAFKPEGTNVNFVQILNDSEIRVRTYERGVEQETLSCGTGVTASVLVLNALNKISGPSITVHTCGGILKVIQDDSRVYLEGPARIVFMGKRFESFELR